MLWLAYLREEEYETSTVQDFKLCNNSRVRFQPFDNVQEISFEHDSLAHFPFPISFLPDLFFVRCALLESPHHHHCWRCKRIEYCVLLIVQSDREAMEKEREEGKNGRDCVTLLFFVACFFFLLSTPRRISCLRYILTAVAVHRAVYEL